MPHRAYRLRELLLPENGVLPLPLSPAWSLVALYSDFRKPGAMVLTGRSAQGEQVECLAWPAGEGGAVARTELFRLVLPVEAKRDLATPFLADLVRWLTELEASLTAEHKAAITSLLSAAEQEDWSGTLCLPDAHLTEAPTPCRVATEAAITAWRQTRYRRAIQLAEQAVTDAESLPARLTALLNRFEMQRRLGWTREALGSLQAARELAPEDQSLLNLEYRFYLERGSVEQALAVKRQQVNASPADAWQVRRLFDLLLALYRYEEADQVLDRLCELVTAAPEHSASSEGLRTTVAEACLAGGRFAEAERLLAGVSGDSARLERAQLALACGCGAEARAEYQALPERHARSRQVRLGQLVAGYLLGKAVGDSLLALWNERRAEVEAAVWCIAALRREGRLAEAAQVALTIRKTETDASVYPAFALELRMLHDEGALTDHISWSPEYDTILRPLLETVLPGSAGLASPNPLAAVSSREVQSVLDQMQGNRGQSPTFLPPGPDLPVERPQSELLRLVRLQELPRMAAYHAQTCFEFEPWEQVMARFEQVIARFPESAYPHCYRGELYLWQRRIDEALADFRMARAKHENTTWAWVGEAATLTIGGRYEEAQVLFAESLRRRGLTAASAHVFRGEAFARQGRLAEAATFLDNARKLHPVRLAAHLLRALVGIWCGEEPLVREIMVHAVQAGPGLLSDAVGQDVPLSEVPAWPLPELERLIERCLELMGGNRSSIHRCYFLPGGVVRFGPRVEDRKGR